MGKKKKKKKLKQRKIPRKRFPIKSPMEQIAEAIRIAREGKGEYTFLVSANEPTKTYVFIGPNTIFEKLRKLTFPALINDHAMLPGSSSSQPPNIFISDNELDYDPREIWEVSSTRRRFIETAAALCDSVSFDGSGSGLRLLSPCTQAAVCSCLLGQKTTLIMEYVDYQEFYEAICQFIKNGQTPERLFFVPPQ